VLVKMTAQDFGWKSISKKVPKLVSLNKMIGFSSQGLQDNGYGVRIHITVKKSRREYWL